MRKVAHYQPPGILLKPNWSIRNSEDGIDLAVERYKRYLENKGFRPTTIRHRPLSPSPCTRFALQSRQLPSLGMDLDLYSTVTLRSRRFNALVAPRDYLKEWNDNAHMFFFRYFKCMNIGGI
jgi:hypothetical protein